MSNFTIEITAPSIVAVLEKLISAITPKQLEVRQSIAPAPMPQTSPKMATQQPIVPTPAYAPPAAQTAQQPPQYRPAPVQQYQPGAPVNTTPTTPIQTPATPPMNNANAAPQQTAPLNTQAPVAAAPAYQIDDLARAAAQLMDAGKQQDLLALLGQFNVQTLGQLPPEQFGAFATALRQMGAKI